MNNHRTIPTKFPKSPSGIHGLDMITHGGLPTGRATLVMGNAGCGKTLLSMEFIVRGIREHGEPGLFVTFEETADELIQNVRSLGWDLELLIADKKLMLDHIVIDQQEVIETGAYNLEGLFIRLAAGIAAVGAKRLVLDTIESLFSSFQDVGLMRTELRRLIHWLKDHGVTTVFTGELGVKGSTRHGIEDYVSDCVIRLDHRIIGQVSTRRLQVQKYRGSRHGTNEYPFTIGSRGLQILPITGVSLNHVVTDERISTGIPQLDTMLGGSGYYRGSSILVSGTAGNGKTSIAAHFVDAACRRGERALYVSFEESPQQLQRNMHSIGMDLAAWETRGLLNIRALRPTTLGIESLLVDLYSWIDADNPRVVVVDPISNLIRGGDLLGVQTMLTRLLDHLKEREITALFTDLTSGGRAEEATQVAVSSLIDTWLLLRAVESCGERNRLLYLVKSRGMAHSNQIREFLIGNQGIDLVDVYLGSGGVLTGSARYSQEALEQSQAEVQQRAKIRRQDKLEHERQIAEARIAVIRAELAEQEEILMQELNGNDTFITALHIDREVMRMRRGGIIQDDVPE